MAPASKRQTSKKQLKPKGKKVEKKAQFAEKKIKASKKKPVVKDDSEDSVVEDVDDSEDDVFKKLQRVMDENDDDSEAEAGSDKEEAEILDEDDDSDLPSEYEREMAVDSDNDEEDDDDDEDDGEENVEKLKKDINQHKKDMEALKERDPEFYEFLRKEDANLLDFEESDVEERSEAEDDEEDQTMEESGQSAFDIPVLTKATLNEWVETIKKNNDFTTFKKLLSAFKTAARMSEEDDSVNLTIKIDDAAVFSKVIINTLRLAPVVFAHNLKPKKENGSPLTSGRWSFFKSYVKTYLNNLLHLLRNLTDPDMLRLTIREAEKCTNLFVCFDRLAKEYLKQLLNSWSNLGSTDSVRMQAFLNIKSLAIIPVPVSKDTHSQGYLDICLKNVYLTFVKNSKNTNLHTLPVINLMRNLAVQLYGINPTLSYQQGFVYVRQLAIHLRQAMKVRSVKNHNMIYNWQYIHCIDFWADVLNSYSGPMVDEDGDSVESPLKALLYPLTQVAIGVIQLIPTAQYYPLRFHVLRSLTSLVHNTDIFIPIPSFILEVLESKISMDKAKNTNSGMPTDWDLTLKINKKLVHSRMYQDEILEQCAKALKSYYKNFYYQISFPEMVDSDIISLKRFVKKSKSLKGKEKLQKLAKELEAKSKFVLHQRANATFSPQDTEEIIKFNADLKAKLT